MIWSPIVWGDTIYQSLALLLNKYWGLWWAPMQHIRTKCITKDLTELSRILWHPKQLAGKEQRGKQERKTWERHVQWVAFNQAQMQGKQPGLLDWCCRRGRPGVHLPSPAHLCRLPAQGLGSLKNRCNLQWHFTLEALIWFPNSCLIWFQHLD